MMGKIESFRDLEVYKRLFDLAHETYLVTLTFPNFEKFELGSQLRRSSNSAPANVAEGWNNKHLNIYLEGITRALGEVQETDHHLATAKKREYLTSNQYAHFADGYDQCGKMLKGLHRSLERYGLK